MELLTVGPGISLRFCLLLGLYYSYWVAVSSFDMRASAKSTFIFVFMFDCWLLEACFILGNGGEQLCEQSYWEVEEGDTVLGIYCIREESIFNEELSKILYVLKEQ